MSTFDRVFILIAFSLVGFIIMVGFRGHECKCKCECVVPVKENKAEKTIERKADVPIGSLIKRTHWRKPTRPGWYVMYNGHTWIPVNVYLYHYNGKLRIMDPEGEAPKYVEETRITDWIGEIYLGEE